MTSTQQAPSKNKNGTHKVATTPSSASSAPALAEALSEGLAVGGQYTLKGDDYNTLKTAQSKVGPLQIALAEAWENWRHQEAQILPMIEKAKADFRTVMDMLGEKNGVAVKNTTQKHSFDLDTFTFIRNE